jgi:hypothetical protein
MILGISEDFTSDAVLDSDLTSLPTSGLYLNSGVHPSVTTQNLLDFLPKPTFTFTAWNAATTYGVFLTTRNKTNIVSYNSKVYQSIQGTNLNQQPDTQTAYWLETNIESLRLKIFIEKVKDRVYSDLSLTKRLVNNQYIYENGDTITTLPNDYAGWVLEPKGSDYVSIRINEMSVQMDGTTPVNLYVINQNTLQDTIQLTPSNGELVFTATDITLSGKGQFKLIIDSTDVYVSGASIDPLRFDGFVAYTTTGTGVAPQTATYTYGTSGNGLGLNISAYLDATQYIDNNLVDFGNFIRATFELMVFEMYLHNSNNRSNRVQRLQMNDDLLIAELKNMQGETMIRKYHRERKRAIAVLEKTFDTQLNDHDGIEVNIGSV